MTFKEWINEIIKTGLLCSEYTDKVNGALSKKQLLDVVLDANGSSWLPEMDAKGYPLPYETILKEFKGFINGRYVAEFTNEKGNGYSSCIYCCYPESDIEINTTLTTILGCTADVWIQANDFVRIYADKNCQLAIHCHESSRCIVEYWDGVTIDVLDGDSNVTLIKH